jgi:hypothetical protein
MSSIKIIGVCGNKYNGKDTIADHLVKNYGFTKISFGDPLKNALKHIFMFSDEQLWGCEKENIDPYWGISPRVMMQFIGTDCLRLQIKNNFPTINDNIWIMAIKRQIDILISKGIKKIVIPDIRFPNEEKMLHQHYNSSIIKVIRKNIISSDTHVSENLLHDIKCDITINNETLQQLYFDVDDIMKDIMKPL